MSAVDPYRCFVSGASQNPGRSAASVLVVRGKHTAIKHQEKDHADYEETLWAALSVGLILLASKSSVPVELVVPSRTMLAVASPPAATDTKFLALGKEALEHFNAARGPDAQATVRMPRVDEREFTMKAHDAAYATAFPSPSDRPVVVALDTSTTEGGATDTR